MILQEIIEDYTTLVKTYSDKGVMIRKVGTDELYSEAIDPQKFNRKYEETDIPIDDGINGNSENEEEEVIQ